ncbi:MAG: hypothetical protein ABI142_02095, partial [Bryocella sp.]
MSTQEHLARLGEELRMGTDLYNRIHFLYWSICDTQETVRFLDTKAAFCVTLVSGMVAVSLEHRLNGTLIREILFPMFIAVVAATVLVCLRVIFPTIIPHGSKGAAATPKFFIGHNKGHHWLRHTIRNPKVNILSENHLSHKAAMHAANDTSLVDSLSETAVTLAFIRQI